MPTGKLASIEDALHTRLGILVLSPVVAIAWPDIEFSPPDGAPYLVPTFLPNQTDLGGVGVNAPRRHRGLYQVTVKGVLGQGSNPNSEIADAIIEHFADQFLDAGGFNVRVGSYDGGPSVPWRVAAIRQDVTSDIPVTIPWWADFFP